MNSMAQNEIIPEEETLFKTSYLIPEKELKQVYDDLRFQSQGEDNANILMDSHDAKTEEVSPSKKRKKEEPNEDNIVTGYDKEDETLTAKRKISAKILAFAPASIKNLFNLFLSKWEQNKINFFDINKRFEIIIRNTVIYGSDISDILLFLFEIGNKFLTGKKTRLKTGERVNIPQGTKDFIHLLKDQFKSLKNLNNIFQFSIDRMTIAYQKKFDVFKKHVIRELNVSSSETESDSNNDDDNDDDDDDDDDNDNDDKNLKEDEQKRQDRRQTIDFSLTPHPNRHFPTFNAITPHTDYDPDNWSLGDITMNNEKILVDRGEMTDNDISKMNFHTNENKPTNIDEDDVDKATDPRPVPPKKKKGKKPKNPPPAEEGSMLYELQNAQAVLDPTPTAQGQTPLNPVVRGSLQDFYAPVHGFSDRTLYLPLAELEKYNQGTLATAHSSSSSEEEEEKEKEDG